MLIDTQLHLIEPVRFPFNPSVGGYVPRPDETGDLAALLSVLDEYRVDAGVLVQPSAYGTDNSAMFYGMTQAGDRFRGVVMTAPDESVPERSDAVSGVRLNLTDYAAHDSGTALDLGARVLRRNQILQLQARPPELRALLAQLPDGAVILDHLGRPDPGNADDVQMVLDLADRAETWLKVSGGFRLGSQWQSPPASIRRLVDAWPDDRLLWGSDWPFLNIRGQRPTYAQVMDWAGSLTDLDLASHNAARLFGWTDV